MTQQAPYPSSTPSERVSSGGVDPVNAVLKLLVAQHENPNLLEPQWRGPEAFKSLVGTMPKEELERALLELARRFVMAMTATREHVALLALTEFHMDPHAVDRLNLPTLLGSLMGSELPAVDEARTCSGCAFRQGSAANQCAPTVIDALDCLGSAEPFMCHDGLAGDAEPGNLCRGFAQAVKRCGKGGGA